MATFYLDFKNGNDANDGTTFANRWKTYNSGATAARTAPGDVIRIMKSDDPTALGQNATFTNQSRTITLTSAVTATIHACDVVWTDDMGNNGSTALVTSGQKEGTGFVQIIPVAGFSTGRMAHISISSTNFSAYQQVSFWIKTDVALSSGDLTLRLCSDTAGLTAVDTLTVPAIPVPGVWQSVTIDKGSALGSAIQSVALYMAVDRGALTISLDNIVACKSAASADSLTLNSLIGKQSAGTNPELWYSIKSISGTTVMIDDAVSADASTGKGYYGTTETVACYKREPILLTSLQTVQEAGTDTSRITYSGGWDQTDMSTQNGVTWVSAQGAGYYITRASRVGVDFEKIGMVRGLLQGTGTNSNTTDCYAVSSDGTAISAQASNTLTRVVVSNGGGGIAGSNNVTLRDCYSINCTAGFGLTGDCTVIGGGAFNSSTTAVTGGNRTRISNFTSADNATAGFGSSGTAAVAYLYNCTLGESTEFTPPSSATVGVTARYHSTKHDGISDNHKIVASGGQIASDSSVRHTDAGIAWKLSPTSTVRDQYWPLDLKVLTVLCKANVQTTISAWLRRSNTALSMGIAVRGGQIGGVDSNITTFMTAAADTWEQVSLTFTPNETGVVDIEVWAYGGTTHNGWIDDLSFT